MLKFPSFKTSNIYSKPVKPVKPVKPEVKPKVKPEVKPAVKKDELTNKLPAAAIYFLNK